MTSAHALVAIGTVLAVCPMTVIADLKPTNLRCEYQVNPLGIDEPRPRLSWILESPQRRQVQTAYQVLVRCPLA